MFSSFKRQQESSALQKPLLNEDEFHQLRLLTEQIDCSSISDKTSDSRHTGNLTTRALGSGLDYAESRVYQAGDDPRSINWRLSARSQETFVKTYHVESRPSLCIVFDKRRSMIFGTRKRLKVTQALRVATLIAYAAERHHIDFQAWVVNDDVLENGDSENLQYFDDVNTFLLNANKPVNTVYKSHKTNISPALQELNQRAEKGSLIYLISDFEDFDKFHQAELAQMQERCFVQALHIFDIAERNLPALGKVRLQALHQARSFAINTHKEQQQKAFTDAAKNHFEHKKSLITDLAISYCDIATDDDNIQHAIKLPLGQP